MTSLSVYCIVISMKKLSHNFAGNQNVCHSGERDSLKQSIEMDNFIKKVYICISIKDADTLSSLHFASRDLPAKKNDDYHITLRFIQEIEKTSMAGLIEDIKWICEHHKSFALTLASPGSFPGVAWYGVESSLSLMELQADIDRVALNLGLPSADYSYNPHITLARVQEEPDILQAAPKTWRVDDLEIRQSVAGGDDVILSRINL